MARSKNLEFELHILVGLPGSGKTTFANEHKEYYIGADGYKVKNYNASFYADIVDFDFIREKYQKGSIKSLDYNDLDLCSMAFYNFRNNKVILDGLFLTHADFEWVIGLYLSNSRYTISKIVFHYWVPDVEACLWNDSNRRMVDSQYSINNLKIEKPDKKRIESKFGIPTKLEIHSVVRKPDYLVACDNLGLSKIIDNKYLMSSTWSLGGTGRGWDGHTYPLSAEEPVNFDEFDTLLESIYPSLTFLQYKKLYSKCVEMRERNSSDYYSNTTDGYYVCDLEKLFNMLREMGLIE